MKDGYLWKLKIKIYGHLWLIDGHFWPNQARSANKNIHDYPIRGWAQKEKRRLNLEEIKIYIKSSLEWLNDFIILFASVVQPRLDGKVIYIKMQSILI